MKPGLALVTGLLSMALAGAEPPKALATKLKTPQSVVVGPGGRILIAVIGELGKDGDGAIMRIDDGKPVPFVTGLNDPFGIATFQQWLFVTDRDRVLKIDAKGNVDVLADARAFPKPPEFLNDITADPETGLLYVTDSGAGRLAVLRITPRGKVDLVIDKRTLPSLHTPNGIAMDGQSHLLLGDFGTGKLYRIRLADRSAQVVADGVGACDGICFDHYGRVFITEWKEGRIACIPRPGMAPVTIAEGFKHPTDLCYDPATRSLLVPDEGAGTLTRVPISVPGHEVDETPLPLHTEVAFPNLQWTGWKGETDTGKANPLRPIFLTHANDNSGRVFVATQHGVIHHFPNDQNATQTTVFLDIQDRVSYRDDQNEEGFLGLAFHPKFKDNGEFFVFYTTKKAKLTNVVSRFRVRKDDPTRADPDSEEQILEFKKPFWNHDGGTIIFGPDGYLYITHGDGGAANDPYDNAQNMNRWLGKVLRIDVDSPDRISKQKNYAVPKDNPFVGTAACPEIWAAGLRNIWRMAFDRKTGKLWAGDVGQNLFEEIDIIEKGGNYGWNRREGLHPFGPKGTGPRKEFIEPIWEYHHDVGKSITGGAVYRGPRLPELDGMYLYADYVSAKIWALKYDEGKGRVVANRPIKDRGLPIFSFGEDDKGEVYFLTPTTTGKGIYWFAK